MAQLWVTYEELGRHLNCSPHLAREHVLQSSWSRRKCSDGATRVKLPAPVMEDYIRVSWTPPGVEPAFAASPVPSPVSTPVPTWQPVRLAKRHFG